MLVESSKGERAGLIIKRYRCGRQIIEESASIIRKKKETGFMPVSFTYSELLSLPAGELSFVTRIGYDSRLDRRRHLYPRAGVLR